MRATLSVLCGVLAGAGVSIFSFFVLMVRLDSGTTLESAITSLYLAAPFGVGGAVGIGLMAGIFAGAWIFQKAA